MRGIFATRKFARWAMKEGLSARALCRCWRRLEAGAIDANLGGSVVKQRVALPGRGKRGGARLLAVFRPDDLMVFIHGFAKGERDTLTTIEMRALKMVAQAYIEMDDHGLNRLVAIGEVTEIECDGY